jgi:adenine phosphoribosyltransferase
MHLRDYIRDVPDFPQKGIIFKDITPLLKDRQAFREAVEALSAPFQQSHPHLVVGVESRGFILGGAVAKQLGVGFVPVRKPGKLPAESIREEYTLEYGVDALEIHRDSVQKGDRILVIDDLLATGGTAAATIRLVEKLGGNILGFAFLIELVFLKGRDKLQGVPLHVLIRYDAE